MAPELDERRLEEFGRHLAASSQRRIDREALWTAFARAFPGRPQGADERLWFRAAMDELAKRRLIRLPARRSPQWDLSGPIAIPTAATLVRNDGVPKSRDWRLFPWHPRLAWVADLVALTASEEAFLRRVHSGILREDFSQPAPLKYRSLQLTGDEKALAVLMGGRLFASGRLDAQLLGCMDDIPPIAWERVGDGTTVLLVENAGAFQVARAVLRSLDAPPYGILAYGGGGAVERSLPHLTTICHPISAMHYLGDIDRAGLRIARATEAVARAVGLPALEPASGLHSAMLAAADALGHPEGWPTGMDQGNPANDLTLVSWLPPDIRSPIAAILLRGNRIPEEVLTSWSMRATWR